MTVAHDIITQFRTTYQGTSHSQIGQDIMVMALTKQRRNGYFVEFGVMDGKMYSNTLVLEQELGWQGIVCEPAQIFHDDLHHNRTCRIDLRAVAGVSGQQLEFKETDTELGLSGLIDYFDAGECHTARRRSSAGRTYKVETVSLDDLLVQHQAPDQIDYISMDTEGSEYAILTNFDFNKHRVRIFSIEHNYLEPRRQDIKDFMAQKGYQHIASELSRHDDWFVDTTVL
jgi:FkbM family methyltransferase